MKQLSVRISLVEEIQIDGIPDSELSALHCAVWLDDGGLAICDEFNHRIILLDKNGSVSCVVGGRGNGPGQFWYPRGMALCANDGVNELIVCDSWNHRIQRFDQQGSFLGGFGGVGSEPDQFNEPVWAAPAGNGETWVLDRCNHRVKRTSLETGKTLESHGWLSRRYDEDVTLDPLLLIDDPSLLLSTVGFNYPASFAIDEHGSFIIADTNNNRICIVNSDGTFENVINFCGLDCAPKVFPISVTLLAGDLLIVGTLGGHHMLIDLKNRWRQATIELNIAKHKSVPVPILARLNGDEYDLLAIDGKRGIITRHRLAIEQVNLPQALAMDDISTWTECDGREWLSCILEQEQGALDEGLIESYISNSILAADSSQKALHKAEEELCLMQAELTENILLRYINSPTSFAQGEYDKSVFRFMDIVIDWRVLTKRRLLMLRIFITNIVRVAFVRAHCSAIEGNDRFEEKLGKLASFFDEEHAKQREEFDGISNWFMKFPREKSVPSPSAVSQWMRALIYVRLRLDLLERLQKLIDPGRAINHSEEYTLPTWAPVAADLMDDEKSFKEWAPGALHFWAFHTMQAIFLGWGDYELAILACDDFRRKFHKMHPEELDRYHYLMGLLFSTKRDFAKSSEHYEKLFDAQSDKGGAHGIAYILALSYHLNDPANPRCDELISHFLPMGDDLGDAKAQWEALEQGRNLRGKASTKSASSAQKPYQHIRSIELIHPGSGRPIIPSLFVPISLTAAIVSDIGSKELFSYQADGSKLTLLESGLMATGILYSPSMGTFITHEPKWVSRRSPLLRMTENGIEEVVLPATLLANTLCQAVELADGRVVVHDYYSKLTCLLGDNFSNCTNLHEVETSFSGMVVTDNAIFCSSLEQNGLYRIDLANFLITRLPTEEILFPTAIAADSNDRLYVGVPGALQIFDQNGHILHTIESFKNAGITYNLGHVPDIVCVESFLGGNLLVSDESNKMVHILQV